MLSKDIPLAKLNEKNRGTIMEVIGIEYTGVGDDFLAAKMPVDHRTHQPVGLLHGGATAVLAETLGSMGSAIIVGQDFNVIGIEINANHLRSVTSGYVYGKATIIHKGKTMHVWNVEVHDDEQRLVAICRLTVLILPKKTA